MSKNCTVTFFSSPALMNDIEEFAKKYGHTLKENSVELTWPGAIALVNHTNNVFSSSIESGELSVSIFVSAQQAKKKTSRVSEQDMKKIADICKEDRRRDVVVMPPAAPTPWRDTVMMYGMIPDPNIAWQSDDERLFAPVSGDEIFNTATDVMTKLAVDADSAEKLTKTSINVDVSKETKK